MMTTTRSPRPAHRRRTLGALVVAVVSAAAPVCAQTNLETNSGIRFNFSPPGAPNLALGGAFIGLADDATAAYTNPAGLTKVVHTEFTVEARHWDYTHVYTNSGRLDTPEARQLGLSVGLIDGEARDSLTAPSFLSFVYPGRHWALALYRHELVNFEAQFSTDGAYLLPIRRRATTGIPGDHDGRLASLRNTMRLEIANYGFAGAYRFGANFSLGLALSYYDFAIDSRAERYVTQFDQPADFKELQNYQTQKGNDADWSGTMGLLWESRHKLVSFGGVYHHGPSFDFHAASTGVRSPADALEQPARFHVPNAWGFGIGLRPTDALRIAADYDRIEYSALKDNLIDIFELDKLTPSVDPELAAFKVDDVDEFHLGVEYFFLRHRHRLPLSILAGVWYDPDHSLRFEGKNEAFRALFRRRPDQVHYTLGMGFSARRFQAYAAYDHSDRTRALSLSMVYRVLWQHGSGTVRK